MSRVLLTWELGLNWGHLTRLLPVAQRLRAEGHTVLVASRDVQAAASVLGPNDISFVQAPHLPKGIPLDHRAAGYADILLSQGWSDVSALWGLTQGWINLIRMFRPDRMVLDYSPTMMLAARITRVPSVLVGNGFELPPATDPLPAFPGFSWATEERAAAAERLCVRSANDVLKAYRSPGISALRDLFIEHPRLFATFPELDHYGARADTHYIGPLLATLKLPTVVWPEGEGPRIFACLRPDTSHVWEILSALADSEGRIVCVASGFIPEQLRQYARPHLRFSLGPIDLQPLLDADLTLTYGAEGTIMRFLAAGVPQLISPWHVETYMAVKQIETANFGRRLNGSSDPKVMMRSLLEDLALRDRVKAFASTVAAGGWGAPARVAAEMANCKPPQPGVQQNGLFDRADTRAVRAREHIDECRASS